MKNPWLARNPFLSMWLSGAHSAFGAARGHAMNAARRRQRSLMTEGSRAMIAFWSGMAPATPARKRKRR